MPKPLRLLFPPRSPLALATWLSRHQVVSVAFAIGISIVVGWSAAIGHSGAELLAYVAPLMVCGVLATRPALPQSMRELAMVTGLFTAAALAASLADGSVIAPIGYLVALSLSALYERRLPLLFGLSLAAIHEALFGTVIPPGASIDGLPNWAASLIYGLSFAVLAGLLTVPWRSNAVDRQLAVSRAGELKDLAAVAEVVVAVDLDGRVTNISEHGLELLGLSWLDVIGKEWFELTVDPEHLEASRAGHAALVSKDRIPLTAPKFFQFDHAIRRGDGERRVFRWRVTVSTTGGVATGTVAAGVDITDTRRAQRQLLREQRDLARLALLAQAVARETDARQAVVDHILELADASFVALIEASSDPDELEVTRSSALELIGTRVPLTSSPSGTGIAYTGGKPFFVPDAQDHAMINEGLRKLTGAASFLFQPVIVEERIAGVLAVGWEQRVPELGSRQTNLVALAADEAASAIQRLAAMQRWEDAAHTDVLTGVPNRRAFEQLFEQALRHARDHDQPLSVALMDLNGFKVLNDTQGHAAGDRVLKESASLWLDELRPTDVLARLGGDEFAVVLPKCGAADIESVADRLRGALRHEAGSGVGIAVWDREESAGALLHRADEALYADKSSRAQDRLHDAGRLAAVEATGLLHAPADPELDALTEIVTNLLDVPVVSLTLVTEDRQFFASQCGLAPSLAEARENSLEWSYCQHPATTGRELVVSDAREHPLLSANRSTTEGGLRGYAGIPLSAGGEVFGVLCAITFEPRAWSPDDLGTLRSVASRATDLIAARAAADH